MAQARSAEQFATNSKNNKIYEYIHEETKNKITTNFAVKVREFNSPKLGNSQHFHSLFSDKAIIIEDFFSNIAF